MSFRYIKRTTAKDQLQVDDDILGMFSVTEPPEPEAGVRGIVPGLKGIERASVKTQVSVRVPPSVLVSLRVFVLGAVLSSWGIILHVGTAKRYSTHARTFTHHHPSPRGDARRNTVAPTTG